MRLVRHLVPLSAGWLVLAVAGCGGGDAPTKAAGPAHQHEHIPPHGGTAVELGKEQFHLELIRDVAAGTLTAYVMDGELEQFIRIAAPSFSMVAQVGGDAKTLVFHPVANAATGEKAGDTSQFEAAADWLKTTPTFDAVLTELTVRSGLFKNVRFNYPKGNE
jgi:hypothetical protein